MLSSGGFVLAQTVIQLPGGLVKHINQFHDSSSDLNSSKLYDFNIGNLKLVKITEKLLFTLQK